jgi:hypothetical protein
MDTKDELTFGCYNYCDYRCDTCEYSAECPVYQEELKATQEGKDWTEVVKDSFAKTREMLRTYMEENDIELLPEDNEYEQEYNRIQEEVKKTDAHRLAHDYMSKAMAFLDGYPNAAFVFSGLRDPATDLGSYCTLLPVKLHRSLVSLYEFAFDEDDFHLMDAFLTSRVVYKALYKSLAAVKTIKKTMNDAPTELDELENLLLEIKTEFKNEFPFEIILALVNHYYSGDPR